MEVVANGYLVDRVDLGDGRARTRWSETAEIPTYCMVIGAADFAITEAGEAGGVPVSHWTYPADSLGGAAAFARLTEIVAFYDSLFGPFPYEKLAHVQSSTRYGGMENSSAIFYSEQAIGEAARGRAVAGRQEAGPGLAPLTEVVAHETVHQWFGDAVTEADWRHVWLSEGFADYFAAVFFEFHGGPEGSGATELARWMRAMAEEVFRPLGLARTGSTARHGSGDFMLAFSTGNIIPHYPKVPTYSMTHLADTSLNPILAATVEATEEAILNALTTATSVEGRDRHRVEAISLTRLRTLLRLSP